VSCIFCRDGDFEVRRASSVHPRVLGVLCGYEFVDLLTTASTGALFLDKDQFAVFDCEILHVAGKLELIALLGQFFLQHFADQRHGHGEISDFNFGGIEGGIAIFGAKMSGQGEIHVFASDLGEKLTTNDVSIHGDLVVLNIGNRAGKLHCAACVGRVGGGRTGGGIRGSSRRQQASSLRERG